MLYIDPPDGWRYGFPRPYINPENLPIAQWLHDNGYPEKLLAQGMANHCRYIGTDEELSDLRHRNGWTTPGIDTGVVRSS